MEDSMADFKVKKHAKMMEEEDLDRISKLPESVLHYILSFLSIVEAARTSVLSRQWRHLWLFSVDEFDFGLVMPQDLEQPLDVSSLKGRYFGWVNQVLGSHSDRVEVGEVLNKLRFQFPLSLDKWCHKQIDGWLSYAFAKKVQTLELDFLIYSNPRNCISKIYPFPSRLIVHETDDLSSLKSLSLSGVSVSREDIDAFLAKFRFLEHLKVCAAPELHGFEIDSSSPALKHLEIINCRGLTYAIVQNTSLVSLTLTSVFNLFIGNNPNLVSVCVSVWHVDNGGPILQMLSSCLSRLQVLTLYLNYEGVAQVPQLSELKKLTLIVGPLKQDALARVADLLRLSPKLEKFVLDFVRMKRNAGLKDWKGLKVPLQHLRDVEVRGYYGSVAEDRFLSCIFRLVVAPIQAIIFDPRDSRCDFSPRISSRRSLMSMVRKSDEQRTEQLKLVIPSLLEFIVL